MFRAQPSGTQLFFGEAVRGIDYTCANSALTFCTHLNIAQLPNEMTALHFAAEEGALSALRCLIELGADVNVECAVRAGRST